MSKHGCSWATAPQKGNWRREATTEWILKVKEINDTLFNTMIRENPYFWLCQNKILMSPCSHHCLNKILTLPCLCLYQNPSLPLLIPLCSMSWMQISREVLMLASFYIGVVWMFEFQVGLWCKFDSGDVMWVAEKMWFFIEKTVFNFMLEREHPSGTTMHKSYLILVTPLLMI